MAKPRAVMSSFALLSCCLCMYTYPCVSMKLTLLRAAVVSYHPAGLYN